MVFCAYWIQEDCSTAEEVSVFFFVFFLSATVSLVSIHGVGLAWLTLPHTLASLCGWA